MSFLYHWSLFSNFIIMAIVSAFVVSGIGAIVLKFVYKDEDDDKEDQM